MYEVFFGHKYHRWITNHGILVTNNVRHLSRIQDITLEVWQQAPRKKNAPPAREAGGRGKKDSHRVSAAA